jgi:hypothetical protein
VDRLEPSAILGVVVLEFAPPATWFILKLRSQEKNRSAQEREGAGADAYEASWGRPIHTYEESGPADRHDAVDAGEWSWEEDLCWWCDEETPMCPPAGSVPREAEQPAPAGDW